MAEKTQHRLAYIDWMRGLACLAMFQTHCYDSWLSPAARKSEFFWWSQLGGTLPAPLFLFLAGISFAMMTDGMRRRGASPNEVARKTMLRGGEIFGLALLFRLQEWLLGLPYAPWTDLLRVDVLNMIGLSMVVMGVVCWLVSKGSASLPALRWKNIGVAMGIALGIAMVTPPLWTTMRPRWLPWFLESYVNGVHIYEAPKPWLFAFFPWAAFAFIGLAVGFFLFTDWARANEAKAIALLGAGGAVVGLFALWLDSLRFQLYSTYDFWHTSPNFWVIRVGIVLVIMLGAYAWCRWGFGAKGFSPMIQLGQTSLLVYWVHIELVYGGLSIMEKKSQTVASASVGLLVIFLSMLVLSVIRTRTKGKGAAFLAKIRAARSGNA
jgi:uncharacterized membrane protein